MNRLIREEQLEPVLSMREGFLHVRYPRVLDCKVATKVFQEVTRDKSAGTMVRIHDLRGVQSLLLTPQELYPFVRQVRSLPGVSKVLSIWVSAQKGHEELVELYGTMVEGWGLRVERCVTMEDAIARGRAFLTPR